MNAEYLLDAIGLLDDGLIQEAETYSVQKRKAGYRAWMGLAACLAIVVVLGYGLTHIRMGSKNSASPSGGAPAASGSVESQAPMEPAGSAGGSNGLNSGDPASPGLPPSMEEPAPGDNSNFGSECDYCAAIMVDGVLYWSTDTPVPGEVEESAVRTVTSYTDTQPEEDGQTNFDRSLTTRYAMTDMGLVVLIDQEWILFDPVPPWEK